MTKTLSNFNIKFTKIIAIKWCPYGTKIPKRTTFIVKSTHPNLWWYKYDSDSPGSGNNYVIFKDTKYKVTSWLSFSQEKIFKIINE